MLISCVWPAVTGVPTSRPLASAWIEFAERLTTMTGKSRGVVHWGVPGILPIRLGRPEGRICDSCMANMSG
jgi:hypothetical protein